MTTAVLPSAVRDDEVSQPSQVVLFFRYLRRNKILAIGLAVLLLLVLFTTIGFFVIHPKDAYPLSVATKKPPSLQYPFGTDFFGRNLLAAMVVGMWQTAFIGVLAGALGTLIGAVLGFIAAYFGRLGRRDHTYGLPNLDADPGAADPGRDRRARSISAM